MPSSVYCQTQSECNKNKLRIKYRNNKNNKMRLHCRSVYTSYKQYAEGWMAWYNLQQSKARQGMNHANRICIPNWKKEKNFFFYFCFQNVSLSPRKNTLVTITLWIGSFLVHFNDYLNIHKFSEKETSFFYSFYSILVFSMLFLFNLCIELCTYT